MLLSATEGAEDGLRMDERRRDKWPVGKTGTGLVCPSVGWSDNLPTVSVDN